MQAGGVEGADDVREVGFLLAADGDRQGVADGRRAEVAQNLLDRAALIGVGGISTPEDARARLDAGAGLVQAYTAFVYEGPTWPRRVNRALAAGEGQR